MRNIKALSLLVLAVLTALAAAAYASRWISQRGSTQTVQVVVAAVDIELGSRINPQMLTTVAWPASAVPTGTFADLSKLRERVVKVAIPRGDAILERKLAPAGTQGGLSAVIAEGKRAMTVRVNDVVGVAGFALPGNYVDVMVNMPQDRQGGKDSQISLTVLEQVLVLAVAQEASRDDLKPKVVSAVTLELSPQDAEKLDLARSVGTLSLVLRNQLDKESVATQGITRDQLLSLKQVVQRPVAAAAAPAAPARPRPAAPARVAAAPVPAPAAEARDCVEVISHGTRTQSCF
ncbi:Flp pilus assembly protein CpaB [Ramlibacter sp. MAHUQ-53]|uniref:Flp pilus assembly protein CpaB n=1 Tax=unclassified Ramlibacter TaxID=2617605 RepID=UPI00363CC2E4